MMARSPRRPGLSAALGFFLGYLVISVAASAEPLAAAEAHGPDDFQVLADNIDRYIAQGWSAQQAIPAAAADDAEYLRRVHLDIAGKIPTVAEARDFLADSSPHKRRELIDRLLESPAFIVHFTNLWRAAMLPEADADFQVRYLLPGFEAWLRKQLTENASYAGTVRELLTTPLSPTAVQNTFQLQGGPTPIAFYQAKQLKPENLAAGTARTFLGVRIECAQCHHHPFDIWKREQFWSYAAFFAGVENPGADGILGTVLEVFGRPELAIPDTDQVVEAAFLDGGQPDWQSDIAPRDALADWMTAPDNPYFARAAVNRLWASFFGIGLVDPVDDFSVNNPPSHPELLDELALAFTDHDFDVKYLIRAIAATKTYQLTSRLTDPSQENPRRYARMSVKGLTPEQLFDSLVQATGRFEPYGSQNPFVIGPNSPRAEFLEAFANRSDSPIDQETSIVQALLLMNGQFVGDATNLERSATLSAVVEFPLMSTAERVETLFLAALSRQPRRDELERLVRYIDGGGPTKDSRRALGDVFWAMLNSSEFLFNH